MKRRNFIGNLGKLSLFPLASYQNLAYGLENNRDINTLIEEAGNADNDIDRYEIIKLIAEDEMYAEQGVILLDVADRWANGLTTYWNTEDDLTSPIEEAKGYLGGWFGVNSFPTVLFELVDLLGIDLDEFLPEGFEVPESNYPENIPGNSRLFPLWALYKGRMLVWASLEFDLGEYYYPEARILLAHAYSKFPQNALLAIYNDQPEPWLADIQPADNAPDWANDMREAFNKQLDIIEFWIRERQAPDGQFGGGWGDDVEMWRDWTPLLIGFNIPELNQAMEKFSDGLWSLERMAGGYTSIMSDVEHSAEDSGDSLTMMQLISDDESWRIRSKELINTFEEHFSGINERGIRQFISTYFTSEEILSNPETWFQVSYHFRALQPVFLSWLKEGEGEIYEVIVDWLLGLAELSTAVDGSKPAGVIPAAIHWPDGDTGSNFDWWDPGALNGFYKGTFKYPRFLGPVIITLAQAYYLTGDERFLAVLEHQSALRRSYLNGEFSDTETGGSIGWAADKIGGKMIEAYDKLRAVGIDIDASYPQSERSDYHKWTYNNDFSGISQQLTKLKQSLGYNKCMFTTEVRFTDRIDAFNREYTSQFTALDLSKPNTGLLYRLITGDPGDPFYFPLNQIRWTAEPRNTAMRVKTYPDHLEIEVHNFKSSYQSVQIELIQKESAWIEWGNNNLEPINNHATIQLSPQSSLSFNIVYELTTNIEESKMDVKIYPNPFVDVINYNLIWNSKTKEKAILSISDQAGRNYHEVEIIIQLGRNDITGTWHAISSNGSPLPVGIYFMQLKTNTKVLATEKIIKASG